MKIYVADWMCGPNLVDTAYARDANTGDAFSTEGDIDKAFYIMRELFDLGRNVQLRRLVPRNLGTKKKPDWTKEELLIFVDNKGFTQR